MNDVSSISKSIHHVFTTQTSSDKTPFSDLRKVIGQTGEAAPLTQERITSLSTEQTSLPDQIRNLYFSLRIQLLELLYRSQQIQELPDGVLCDQEKDHLQEDIQTISHTIDELGKFHASLKMQLNQVLAQLPDQDAQASGQNLLEQCLRWVKKQQR